MYETNAKIEWYAGKRFPFIEEDNSVPKDNTAGLNLEEALGKGILMEDDKLIFKIEKNGKKKIPYTGILENAAIINGKIIYLAENNSRSEYSKVVKQFNTYIGLI